MTPLRIVLLSDLRPGHFRLSEGIVAAVQRLRPGTVTTITTRRPKWAGTALALATRVERASPAILRHVYGIDGDSLCPADLVVSAGAETLAANVALARMAACPNIFYGSLRAFRADDFALALTSYRRADMSPRQVVALKPSAFDPDTAPSPPQHARAMLLGGPAPGYVWRDADWCRLATLVAQSPDEVRWTVANSRRTPAAASDLFAALALDSARHRFFDVRNPGTPGLDGVLASSGMVIVTGDSSSMVSEAVWARRRVIAIEPEGAQPTTAEAGYRTWLRAEGWVQPMPIAELDEPALARVAAALRPMRDNPQLALAELIRTRIPGLFECSAPRA